MIDITALFQDEGDEQYPTMEDTDDYPDLILSFRNSSDMHSFIKNYQTVLLDTRVVCFQEKYE